MALPAAQRGALAGRLEEARLWGQADAAPLLPQLPPLLPSRATTLTRLLADSRWGAIGFVAEPL